MAANYLRTPVYFARRMPKGFRSHNRRIFKSPGTKRDQSLKDRFLDNASYEHNKLRFLPNVC
jgi:hypothetical protein